MPIRTACSSCGKQLNIRDELVGKKAKCPECGHLFVASPSDAAAASGKAPSKPPAMKSLAPDQDHETPERVPTTLGPLQILESIGRGGMASVHKARHLDTGQLVAVKIGHRFLALDPTNFERFKREFTAVRELRHPHLVETLDFGETDGVPYLVLEFVPGQNLEQRLKRPGARRSTAVGRAVVALRAHQATQIGVVKSDLEVGHWPGCRSVPT